MSNFLTNLARRGAGLLPSIAPRFVSAPSPAAAAAASPAHAAADQDAPVRDAVLDPGTALWNRPRIDRPSRHESRAAPASVSPATRRDPGRAEIHNPVRPVAPAPRAADRLDRDTTAPARPSEPLRASTAVPAELAPRRPAAPTVQATEAPKAGRDASTGAAPRQRAEQPPLRPRFPAVVVEPHVGPQERALAQPSATPAITMLETRAVRTGSAPPAATAKAPRIHVRIGKVEVRASPPAAPPARTSRPKASGGFAELALARAHLNRTYR